MPYLPDDDLTRRLPRQTTMRELRVFVTVLEHRSFRRAAKVLHLTQPAVTKAIASLEETLGVRLFDRTSQVVEPTPYGLSLAPRAAAVFDELRRAAQDLALVSTGTEGTLRIGILPMPAIPFLPVALRRLAETHPNVRLNVFEERQTELIDRLRKRDIELAILRLALVDPDESMQVDRLFDEKLCVIASRDHHLAESKRLTWPQLMKERWVMTSPDSFFYDFVLRTLERCKLPMPRHVVETPSINIQFGLALHAGMLTFGLRSQTEFAPGKEFVVRLPFELPGPATMVAAVSLRARTLSPLAQQLIGHIRSLAGTA